LDETLKVNMVWSGPGRVAREAIADIPVEISSRMREVSSHGKLVE
jgi:succinate dehydrogenase / fumarate reductase flavoprotein subunit